MRLYKLYIPMEDIPVDQYRLEVFVMTGESVIFNDKATSVSSRNGRGRFDVLPYHTNFISIIKEFISIQRDADHKKDFVIKTGIMRVYENKVQIFVGEA